MISAGERFPSSRYAVRIYKLLIHTVIKNELVPSLKPHYTIYKYET
jgi:hypothetical protein